MGGDGSGNFLKRNLNKTTEDYFSLDLRTLKAMGFKYGIYMSGTVPVLRKGFKAIIAFAIEDNLMDLKYRYRGRDGFWKPVTQTIPLDFINCNYGSKRVYFICPACGKRVMLLYCAKKYFMCRECSDLIYRSQCENKLDRQLRKARKIRDRIDPKSALFSPIPDKPVGMHYKTYYSILDKEREVLTEYIELLQDIS